MLHCLVLRARDGVFVAPGHGNVSLFWSYLMGIFPVSDIVKVVPVSSGPAFPCYLSEHSCDARGAFLSLVLKAGAERWLHALPQQPLGRTDVSCPHTQGQSRSC